MADVGLGGRSGWLRVGSLRAGSLRTAVAALVCASALVLSACDIRLETDPVTFPSPDATAVARNSLADAEAAVLAAATDAGASADGAAPGAAATAQTHLDVLGGVYVAHPGTTPAPSPSVTPAPAATLADAIDAVRTKAEEVAATTDDADLAFLARSIDLDWALRELSAARAAATLAADDAAAQASAQASASPTPEESVTSPNATKPTPLPGDSGDAPFPLASRSASGSAGFAPSAATSGLSDEQLSTLALAEDEARFAYETIAALEFGSLRESILARMRLHGERSDSLATVLASKSDAADPRTPLYQLRDANLPDPDSRDALERSIEIDLGDHYAALLDGASTADAAWLLNAAFDSYARAMATPGFTTADLPTLPGLRVGAATSSASATPSAAPSASSPSSSSVPTPASSS
ncbi:DUF4439 domain-containing protein [Demequina lutea]|uniref:DUF4439 domain-containing protein n=1 Tax=Demequina lutea TaxID=431489 RepID=A0A7Y9ZAK3_9MICO|nr:DUF4439 domain-containing protein [Demequina lutea]NYI41832.1 hypothetical protein [Demequina lutea]